jgi:hypothetical protein
MLPFRSHTKGIQSTLSDLDYDDGWQSVLPDVKVFGFVSSPTVSKGRPAGAAPFRPRPVNHLSKITFRLHAAISRAE